VRRNEGFLKRRHETFKSGWKCKMGSEVQWSKVKWSEDLWWNVCIIINL